MIYPAHYDLPPLILGYDWDFSFIYEVDGEPLNFTGYSMELAIFEDYESAELDSWSSGAGDIEIGSDGVVTFSIPSTDQSNLEVKNYKYVVVLTEPATSGRGYPIMTGDFPAIDINGA